MTDNEAIITVKEIPGLEQRKTDAHKGIFGKVCIIGGSIGMTGAAAIAGTSALRAGSGLVRVATAKSALPIVASIDPSFTTIALPEDNAGRIGSKAVNVILQVVSDNDATAFGPGTGVSPGLKWILSRLIAIEALRLVIDADGLNNLCKIKNWHKYTKARIILTPHPGEMKRLWKSLFREPLPADRQTQAVTMAQTTGAIIVLKGAGTIVTDGRQLYINNTGNPGMATAGAGDSLTGVITALVGQGLSGFDAAVLGVYVHGLAGDLAAEKQGQVSLIATDIVDHLPKAFLKVSSA